MKNATIIAKRLTKNEAVIMGAPEDRRFYTELIRKAKEVVPNLVERGINVSTTKTAYNKFGEKFGLTRSLP